jgi:hypothetical protein
MKGNFAKFGKFTDIEMMKKDQQVNFRRLFNLMPRRQRMFFAARSPASRWMRAGEPGQHCAVQPLVLRQVTARLSITR